MNISVEIMGGLNRRITVVLPPEDFDKTFKSELKKAADTVKLEGGFRRGTPATIKIVEQRYGNSIRAEAADKLINASLFKAFEQEKLHPAGRPVIQSLEAEQGKPFKYTVTFEVYPEITLASMNDVTLEKTVVDIKDADIDQVLEQMRKQYSDWEEAPRASQWNDRVIVDFVRLTDDEPQAGTQQQNVPVILDEKGMPENFHKLVGTKAGDEVVVNLSTNPEDKQQAQIKVIKVEAAKLPEINDEFAKRLGAEDGTVAGLRNQVKSHMQQELDNVLKNKLKTQLIDKLIEKNSVELPKALVETEQQHIEKEWRERMLKSAGNNSNIQLPEMPKDKSLEVARRRVTLSLLFAELIKKYELKIDEDRVRTQVERIAGSFQDSAAIINMLYKQPEILNNVRSQVMEEQVVEKLLEQVKYTEKTENYNDVMKFNPQHDEHEHHDHANCDHDHHEHCDHDH